MTVVLLLLACAVGIAVGRIVVGHWFNHVMVYSVTWTVSLSLYALGLIHYYEITRLAWTYITLAWVQVVLGAIIGRVLSRAMEAGPQPAEASRERDLTVVVLVLSAVGSFAAIGSLLLSVRQMGGWVPALTAGVTQRYQLRLTGQLEGDVPYVGALLLAGCAFGGLRAARRGRIDFTGLLPLLLLVLHGVTMGGRTMIGIGIVVYVTCLLLPGVTRPAASALPARAKTRRRLLMLALSGTVAIGGVAFVSATRGLVVDLPGVDPRLSAMSRYVPFLPSIYAHASGSPVAFSEYLKSEPPRLFPGAYTFAPAWRVFARVTGADTHVPYYEESYFTPVESNVATWLKNIHTDFGPPGIAWFPFVFSAVLTWLTLRARREHRSSTTVLAANLLAVICFSVLFNFMVIGFWLISTGVSWLVGLVLDHRSRRRLPAVA